jgi:hypothetical protein
MTDEQRALVEQALQRRRSLRGVVGSAGGEGMSGPVSAAPTLTLSDEQRGAIAYQLTKRLVIDMPTARAIIDSAVLAAAPSVE